MPAPLAELTAQARTLSSAGDLVGAREVLAGALTPVDADPRRASPDLASAAALLARILIALGDPHAARVWAGFAHAAEDRLHGPRDERTVAAAALHAAVLHRIGSYGRAAQLYRDLVAQLSAVDGTGSQRVLAAEADLATAEHAAGDCAAARARLNDAWARHRRSYGDAEPAGIKMLARLGAMERECGRTAEASEHLALARDLSARYLPGDHPLARQATALAEAPASGRHVCGRVSRSAGPAAPGVMRVHRPAPPGVRTVGGPAVPLRQPDREPDDLTELDEYAGPAPVFAPGREARPDESDEYAGPAPVFPPGREARPDGKTAPAREARRAGPDGPARLAGKTGPAREARPAGESGLAGDAGLNGDAGLDEEVEPDDRETDPKGAVYQQPLYLSDLQPAPGELTGRHARADTPPPLPGQRPPEVGRDGREIRVGAVKLPDSLKSTPPDRRLPVPTGKREPRSWQPLVLVAALVAGIAVAAAVVIAMLPGPAPAPRASSSTTGSSTSGSTAAPAPAGTLSPSAAATPTSVGGPAPARVRLVDYRDSVSLSWTYPKGSEGPVLISGGRTGQVQRAFQQLPAGTTNYVVYGLNAQSNYCFTVAIVYTVNDVAASKSLCTRRK